MSACINVKILSLTLFIFASSQIVNGQLNIKVDDLEIDRSSFGFTQSYAPILSKSTPAIVSVTTQQFVKRVLPGGGNPIEDFLRRY